VQEALDGEHVGIGHGDLIVHPEIDERHNCSTRLCMAPCSCAARGRRWMTSASGRSW
jgi:hypothetical protein